MNAAEGARKIVQTLTRDKDAEPMQLHTVDNGKHSYRLLAQTKNKQIAYLAFVRDEPAPGIPIIEEEEFIEIMLNDPEIQKELEEAKKDAKYQKSNTDEQ